MKLVLINLYSTATLARYLLSSYVLKAYLDRVFSEDDGVEVAVLDFATDSSIASMGQKILAARPQAVGYSCYLWNIERIVELIQWVGEREMVPQILGGPEIAPSRLTQLAADGIGDYYVCGEGEGRLARLLRNLMHPAQEIPLPSGVYRRRQTNAIEGETSYRAVALTEIPSPYVSGAMDERLYSRRQAFLETQRGCRYKCNYCVYHKHLSRIDHYPLERVLQELDFLILEKDVQALRIIDAVFSSDLTKAKRIVEHLCRLKERNGVRLPWIYWEFTYSSVDDELLAGIARLKTREAIANADDLEALDRPQFFSEMLQDYTAINCTGFQSFHAPVLQACGRPKILPSRLTCFMAHIRRLNLVFKFDMILGLPNETIGSYFEGLSFLLPFLKGTDHILNIHRLQMLPGSQLEAQATRYDLHYSSQAPHLVYETGTMSRQELDRASRLSALLFRMLNSPLRSRFYRAWENNRETLSAFLERTLRAVQNDADLAHSNLVSGAVVDDDYWFGKMFEQIPSAWLSAYLEEHAR